MLLIWSMPRPCTIHMGVRDAKISRMDNGLGTFCNTKSVKAIEERPTWNVWSTAFKVCHVATGWHVALVRGLVAGGTSRFGTVRLSEFCTIGTINQTLLPWYSMVDSKHHMFILYSRHGYRAWLACWKVYMCMLMSEYIDYHYLYVAFLLCLHAGVCCFIICVIHWRYLWFFSHCQREIVSYWDW